MPSNIGNWKVERMELEVVHVRRGRWWGAAAGAALGALIFLFALLGIPAALFDNPSIWMTLLYWFSWVGLPICLIGVAYMLRGALLPEHLRISDQGVSTRGWEVAWEEILDISVDGDPDRSEAQIVLRVTDGAHQREKRGNRWLSGRPLGLGGLPAVDPILRTQRGMELAPSELARLLENHPNYRNPVQ